MGLLFSPFLRQESLFLGRSLAIRGFLPLLIECQLLLLTKRNDAGVLCFLNSFLGGHDGRVPLLPFAVVLGLLQQLDSVLVGIAAILISLCILRDLDGVYGLVDRKRALFVGVHDDRVLLGFRHMIRVLAT